jgi:phage tail tape-measure protein
VGFSVGVAVGAAVGAAVGNAEGAIVGAAVGAAVGTRVGADVGDSVPAIENDIDEKAVLSSESHPSPSGSKQVHAPAVVSKICTVILHDTSGSFTMTRVVGTRDELSGFE